MKAIDKIIFNVLASRRSVVLPGVGTLAVERRPAVVSGKDVQAPENRVVFSETEREEVPTLPRLMELMGVDPQQAQSNYDEWLNEVSSGNGLMIEGVGTLRQTSFTPSPELAQILNPAALADGGARPNRPRCNRLTNILLGVVILLLVALSGLYVYNTYFSGTRVRNLTASMQFAQPEPTIPAEEPAVADEPAAPAVKDVKRFHVVAGTFINESNADAMIKWYKVNYPELTPEKIAYRNGRTIVSLFSTDDEREAFAKMRSLAYSHFKPDYWVCEVIILSR